MTRTIRECFSTFDEVDDVPVNYFTGFIPLEMSEENFHGYFMGDIEATGRERRNHERYGVPGGWYAWGMFHDRFNVASEPNEPNRYGWIVEVDPMDPQSTPIKRSALGRLSMRGQHVWSTVMAGWSYIPEMTSVSNTCIAMFRTRQSIKTIVQQIIHCLMREYYR
ncbi:MAG: hypothetical protein DHS20C01_12640 [marine bacterium B5-7]|nr:MAG: hypothetical protein DHS20C01_12640 [marine bacterium B5-7]